MTTVNLIPDLKGAPAGAPPPESLWFSGSPTTLSLIIIIVFIGCLVIGSLFSCLKGFQGTNSASFSENQEQNDEQDYEDQDDGEDKLAAIPVFTYRETTLSYPFTVSSEREICVVCLGEYADTDIVRVLPICKHMFHKNCIDHWLRVRSSNCPFCRHQTIE